MQSEVQSEEEVGLLVCSHETAHSVSGGSVTSRWQGQTQAQQRVCEGEGQQPPDYSQHQETL